ncbi:hypothetical protein [Streptomyces omiyaensis]|uniref:Secreted protein n=1 Tax=Streptomyces omiyaensis TaxID=68247 RepID=A0ABW7BMI2_9ACTN|nr:hypothetical protein [Streptomyces omiyaensis]GGY29522.1 hypothetical protein GCM10010363_07420 [Streptomyces omiyaensis]
MRRGLVHALAWSLATGAAVTLSWWGVHTVLSGTVYDPPRALPLPGNTTAAGPAPVETALGDPVTASTRRPRTTPPAPPASSSPPPSPAATRTADGAAGTGSPSAPRTAPAPTTAPPAAPSSSRVQSFPSDGGRVTFDLGETSAELVSAIPASGWQMQVWKQPTWIRVSFTQGDREVSVFCLWHDSAPRVQIEERRA